MNNKVYKTLEYYKIINKLEACATSNAGKTLAHRLSPSSDIESIETWQKETSDSLNRIIKQGTLSFEDIIDINEYTKRLEASSSLTSKELLKIASHLSCASNAVRYNNSKLSKESSDSLDPYFNAINPLNDLQKEINKSIISEGEFADNASTTLSEIRRNKNNTKEKIRSQMTSQLSKLSDYLQDQVITSRNGRFCLSVKAEHKSKVKGMVHDQSSSGQTLFIEPIGVVNLNNEIKELELKEAEEIERILLYLSSICHDNLQELIMNYEAMSRLDFIFAKGKLALDMNAMKPQLNQEGIINLKKARHPLLDKESCVPIDILLGNDYDMLIITGPNTGGKTVSLKTCGLLTLMAQAGLHIPVSDNSQIAIFENVYADIGDEQSIEQSLSTFSSHMTNIVRILDGVRSCSEANHKVLCLFDELCAGTDPNEGAALATAILDKLRISNVKTMATTHYSELKLYALSTNNVENASLEFSVESLSPTYRLLYGIPGKSNAFAISKKLGLTDDIINNAKEQISDNNKNFEDIIIDIETKRIQIENDLLEVESEKKRAHNLTKNLEEKNEKLNSQKKRILDEANIEAAKILSDAKHSADEAIRNINKYGKINPDISKLEKERSSLGSKAKKARSDASAKQEINNHNIPKNLQIGDLVKVLSMNIKGTVHTLPNAKGDLQVQMGIMRSTVNISDLILIEEKDALAEKYGYANRKLKKANKNQVQINKKGSINNKSQNTSYEIKLLGLNSDDAIQKLDKYLDDAYLAHIPVVRIVHGKGTGILRQAVHQYLKKHPHVEEFHLGEFGEGDAGVTIVTFK